MKLLSRRVEYLLIVSETKYCEKENRVCKVFQLVFVQLRG